MLNRYFALGVPVALIILYGIILVLRKKSKIPYLGFVLFIIAGFMVAFSYQVLPLGVGILLVIVNIFRAYKRISPQLKS